MLIPAPNVQHPNIPYTAMNLAQVLHQRWSDDDALNATLPASRVYTGPSVDPSTPFGVITRRNARPINTFGDGSGIDTVAVRVEIIHDSYDGAAGIAAAVKGAFDRTAFDLAGADRVLIMRRTDEAEHQGVDGVWRLSLDFHCTVYLASGA